jgi:hypothetical protein
MSFNIKLEKYVVLEAGDTSILLTEKETRELSAALEEMLRRCCLESRDLSSVAGLNNQAMLASISEMEVERKKTLQALEEMQKAAKCCDNTYGCERGVSEGLIYGACKGGSC